MDRHAALAMTDSEPPRRRAAAFFKKAAALSKAYLEADSDI
jgi:hypothetical protein